jgi:tRNA(Ile)-lysidine synthase
VAFSGGPDSTALALILLRLGHDVVLGHVDHAMREGSEGDARHCGQIAGRLGLPFLLRRLATAPSGEASARAARYDALEQMRREAGATAIATGHTLDDDAETLLLRLDRGGYPLGIPPRRGLVARPLLAMRRAETAALCASAGVPVLTDPTNADEAFARNRIRRRVLPALGDPGVLALADLARRTRAAVERRDVEVAAWLESASVLDGDGLRLDRAALETAPEALRRGVVRRGLGLLGLEPSGRLVADICARVVAVPRGRLDLPGGYAAWSSAGEVFVARPPAREPLPSVSLLLPGRTLLPAWGLAVEVAVIAPPPDPCTAAARAAFSGPGPWEALLDASSVTGPLVLRPRQPGDRYRPLGAPGERKLQDVLVDAKVPRGLRDRVPLVTCDGRLAWVVGHRIDDRHKLTPASTAALAVRVRRFLPEGQAPRSMAARPCAQIDPGDGVVTHDNPEEAKRVRRDR